MQRKIKKNILNQLLNKKKMQLIISLTIFSAITDSCLSQVIPDSSKDDSHKSTMKTQDEDPGIPGGKANLRDLFYTPPQASQGGEPNSHVVEYRAPHSVTKLAKTIAYEFDPYFNKGYFEPFESRPKLVTLVAFRKNGLIPKKSVQESQEKDLEVAELQSPFNSISNYWMHPAEFQA